MSISGRINNVLAVMAGNLDDTVQPGFTGSSSIANELGLPLTETKQLLRTMDDLGLIQSSMDAEYSIITHAGLNCLVGLPDCGYNLYV